MRCPPFEIDDAFYEIVEAYRLAKTRAAAAAKRRLSAETGGHYDKDMPLSAKAVAEGEEAVAERLAAIRVADELVQWLDKHHN